MDYSQIGDPNFSPYGDTTAVVTTLQQTLMTDREQHKFGVWVANISYAKGDIVYHHTGTDGGLYGSLVSQNRGFSPLNGDKWRLLMAVSGVGGSGGGLTGIKINSAGNYDNIVFGTGFTVTNNVITATAGGVGGVGDMLKATYDSDADGKVNAAVTADNVAWSGIIGKPSFATVAITGSYNDLLDKPAIPAAQVNSDWTATAGVAVILNKPATFPPTAHLHNEYITEAPITGVPYVRKDGNWVIMPDIEEAGMLISTTTTPGVIRYEEIIFDGNFVVNGNTISLFQNGNIICGTNPNIRSVSTNVGIVANHGMVATAHSVNDTELLTLRPEYTYGNIFEIVGIRPVTGAEATTDYIAALFDARTSDALNRERVYGTVTNVVADVGWNSVIGEVVGSKILVNNLSGVSSDKIDGMHLVYDSGTADVGSAIAISSAVMDKGFTIGLQLGGVTGADSALIRGSDVGCVPNMGIDFSEVDFASGIVLHASCLTITQDGVFDTPCTGKAVFNQGVQVTNDLTVSKIVFADATEMTTAALGGSSYWVSPYVGLDVPGTGNNTLTNGQSRIWHSPTGSHLITRKDDGYLGVQLTLYA